MKQVAKILCLLLITNLFLIGCSSELSSTDGNVKEIKIGTIHPLSGPLAKEGQEMSAAVQMAVDEVNESGGIKSLGGAKVVVVKGDHELKEEKAVSEAQRLISERVLGIIGPYGTALAATKEAERQKTPFIIDVAVADEITERGFKYTFRLQPNATMMVSNFLEYFKTLNEGTGSNLKTAVLSYENSEFGTLIAEDIERRASQAGLEVISKIPHSAAAADFTSEVTKIISLKPDVLVLTTYLNDGTQIIKGLNDYGFTPKVLIGVANGALSNPQFIENETAINQYLMDVNYSTNPKSEKVEQLKKKFKDIYKQNFGPNAAYSYEATKVLLMAIERAGSTDKTKIRDEIAKTHYDDHILPQGTLIFDEKGQNPNANAVLSQIVNGTSKVVFPVKYSVAEPVFPTKQ